jgi:hypothetical protein
MQIHEENRIDYFAFRNYLREYGHQVRTIYQNKDLDKMQSYLEISILGKLADITIPEAYEFYDYVGGKWNIAAVPSEAREVGNIRAPYLIVLFNKLGEIFIAEGTLEFI